MSRHNSYHVVVLRIKREIDHEFIEPDNRSLALAVFFEEDDAQLGEPTEFLVDVLHVPVNNPSGLIDAGWLFAADGFDEIEEVLMEQLSSLC